MKPLFFFLLVLLISLTVLSNPTLENKDIDIRVDSLKYLVDVSPEKALSVSIDLEKELVKLNNSILIADLFLLKGLAYQRLGSLDSALSYYQKAYLLSEKENHLSSLIRAHSNLAVISIDLQLYQEAYEHLIKANTIMESFDNKSVNKGEILNNLGLYYHKTDKIDSAIYFYNRAINYYETINDSTDMAVALDNLGQMYDLTGQSEEAIQYYLKASSVNLKNLNYYHLINNYNNIGIHFKNKGSFIESDKYFNLVDSIARQNAFNESLAINSYNRANLYYTMGLHENAKLFYEQSINLCEELGLTYGVIINKMNYARCFANINDLTKSEQLWNEAEKMIHQFHFNSLLPNLYEIRSSIYEENKMFEDALKARNRQVYLEDSLNDQSQKELMENLVKFYETDRKNRIIAFQKEELLQKNRLFWFSVIGLMVFSSLSLVLFIAWNRLRQKNQLLFQQIKRISGLEKSKSPKLENEREENKHSRLLKTLFAQFNSIVLNDEIFLDPTITRTKMAQLVNTNEKYLSQAVKEHTSLNLTEYLNRIRTNKAVDVLMEMTDFDLSSVITQSGFQSERTFFRVFKANTGLTPSQFFRLSKLNKQQYLKNIKGNME